LRPACSFSNGQPQILAIEMENEMIKQKNSKPQTPPKGSPVAHRMPESAPEVKNERQKAEQDEVAGRHKNDGQMGHKGAR